MNTHEKSNPASLTTVKFRISIKSLNIPQGNNALM